MRALGLARVLIFRRSSLSLRTRSPARVVKLLVECANRIQQTAIRLTGFVEFQSDHREADIGGDLRIRQAHLTGVADNIFSLHQRRSHLWSCLLCLLARMRWLGLLAGRC